MVCAKSLTKGSSASDVRLWADFYFRTRILGQVLRHKTNAWLNSARGWCSALPCPATTENGGLILANQTPTLVIAAPSFLSKIPNFKCIFLDA